MLFLKRVWNILLNMYLFYEIHKKSPICYFHPLSFFFFLNSSTFCCCCCMDYFIPCKQTDRNHYCKNCGCYFGRAMKHSAIKPKTIEKSWVGHTSTQIIINIHMRIFLYCQEGQWRKKINLFLPLFLFKKTGDNKNKINMKKKIVF